VANVSATEITTAVTAPGAIARPPAPLGRAGSTALAGGRAVRAARGWLSRAGWTVTRTGRSGLAGIALLLAAALFVVSTHRSVVADVQALRAEVVAAQEQARTAVAQEAADPEPAARALPARTEMPEILRQLYAKATAAELSVDTARYEIDATKGNVVRYRIAFPVTGPYTHIRAFIDEALSTMPSLALKDLALERKSIGDGNVEAQIRMTVYTRSTP
jgi:hypothetical protein